MTDRVARVAADPAVNPDVRIRAAESLALLGRGAQGAARLPGLPVLNRESAASALIDLGYRDQLLHNARSGRVDAWTPTVAGIALCIARDIAGPELLAARAQDPDQDIRTRVYCAEALWLWGFHLGPEPQQQGQALLAALTEDPQLGVEAQQHRGAVDWELGT